MNMYFILYIIVNSMCTYVSPKIQKALNTIMPWNRSNELNVVWDYIFLF